MSWLSRKIDKWASDSQHKEMLNFVSLLQAMDGHEIGHVVALVTHVRHELEAVGHNPMDPIVYTATNPTFPLFLSRTTISLQKQKNTQDAAAFMVWAHTARAGVRLELRQLARALWGELSRGFPHVEEARSSFALLTGNFLSTEGYSRFPAGFTPEPT